MADNYTFNFTDPLKNTFLVNAFTSNGVVSPILDILNASAVSANTCLLFYGKGHPDYGERIEENILHLLENFDGPTAPVRPIPGQLWSQATVYYRHVTSGSPVSTTNWYLWDANTSTWNAITVDESSALTDPSVVGNYRFVSNVLYLRVSVESNIAWIAREFIQKTSAPTGTFPERTLKLYNVDSAQWESTNSIPTQEPSSPIQGQLWYDTSVPELKVWTGTSWVAVAASGAFLPLAGGTMVGDINLDNSSGSPLVGSPLFIPNTSGLNLIRGLTDYSNTPSYGDIAVSKDYVDTVASGTGLGLFVQLSGDNMNAGANITFSTGGEVLGLPATPSATGATSKEYVDNNFVELAGDTMTGTLVFSTPGSPQIAINAGNSFIINVNDPVNAQDVVTKSYADSNFVDAAGDIMTGILTFVVSGSPIISINLNNTYMTGLRNFANTPTDPLAAVSKDYVDTVSGGGSADGVVTSGVYTDSTPGIQTVLLDDVPVVVGSPLGSPQPIFASPLPLAPIGLGDSTGLANNTTVYYTTITVDGVPNVIDIVGQDAQTYQELIDEINIDLVGASAIISGGILIASFTFSSTSSISITLPPGSPAGSVTGSPLELFSSLSEFNSFGAPIVGTDSEIILTTSAPSTVSFVSTHNHNALEIFYSSIINTDVLVNIAPSALSGVIDEIAINAASKTSTLKRKIEDHGGSPQGSPMGSPLLSTTPEYTVGSNRLWVFVNGVKYYLGDGYLENGIVGGTSTSITWITPPAGGDRIEYIII